MAHVRPGPGIVMTMALLICTGAAWTGTAQARVQVLVESVDAMSALDLGSIKRSGTQRRVHITTTYTRPSEISGSGGKQWQSGSADALLDCSKNQYALQRVTVLDEQGKSLSERTAARDEWKPLPPGLPIALAAAASCGRADPKAKTFDTLDAAKRDYLGRHPATRP